MKNLQVQHDIHKQRPNIKVSFTYNRKWVGLVKRHKKAQWNSHLKSWYYV